MLENFGKDPLTGILNQAAPGLIPETSGIRKEDPAAKRRRKIEQASRRANRRIAAKKRRKAHKK